MKPPHEIDSTEWTIDPPPPYYAATKVPEAVLLVGAATDAESSRRATMACLDGFGNGHRGTST